MFLSLGPVMRYELITTSRRRRYYVLQSGLRADLAESTLGIVSASGRRSMHRGPGRCRTGTGRARSRKIQAFAEDSFIQFAGVQGLALLILISALVAGVIPDEFQRKTLHYLLASRLSSAEIVLGKLRRRLVHVVAFVALGLPIVSLLMLYGGLNPVNIFYVYMGTATLVLFAAGFSIAGLGAGARPRDAVLAAYGLGAIWLLRAAERAGSRAILEDGAAGLDAHGQPSAARIRTQFTSGRSRPAGLRPDGGGFIPGWAASWNSFEWHFAVDGKHPGGVRTALSGRRPSPCCVRCAARPGRAGNRETGWFTRIRAGFRRFAEATCNRGARAQRAACSHAGIARRAARIPCSGRSDSPAWGAG